VEINDSAKVANNWFHRKHYRKQPVVCDCFWVLSAMATNWTRSLRPSGGKIRVRQRSEGFKSGVNNGGFVWDGKRMVRWHSSRSIILTRCQPDVNSTLSKVTKLEWYWGRVTEKHSRTGGTVHVADRRRLLADRVGLLHATGSLSALQARLSSSGR